MTGVQGAGVPGGANFAIGALFRGNAAPGDGSTWLECDGSAVSQATYAALYAILGHTWMSFAASSNINVVGHVTAAMTWTGTKWISISTASAVARVSTDGITWADAGTVTTNSNQATVAIASNNGGGLVISNNSSTTGSFSGDHGATWSSVTFPTISAWVIRNDGAGHWVGIKPSSRDVITSPDGTTWTTQTNALPAALAANGNELYWDGTNWLVLANANGVVAAYKTATASGASGWAAITLTNYPIGPNASGGAARNGSAIVHVGNGQLTSKSTVQFSTITYGDVGKFVNTSGNNPQLVYWNGFTYVWIINSGVNNSLSYKCSADGITWSEEIAVPVNVGNFNNVAALGSDSQRTSAMVDTATGKMLLVSIGILSTNTSTAVLTPTCNTSTQFCLPRFRGIPKTWIKAL